jgi:hypothetical protein
MKDQLIAILEAMRLSLTALRKHSEPDGPTAEVTLEELRRFLLESHVVSAIEALCPNVESPALCPNVESPAMSPDDSESGGLHDRQARRQLS